MKETYDLILFLVTQVRDLQKALEPWHGEGEWVMEVRIANDGIWLWATDGGEEYRAKSLRDLLQAIQSAWRDVYRVLPKANQCDYRGAEQRSNIKATLGEIKRRLKAERERKGGEGEWRP